jgi:epoxyqueuosine reductase
MNALTDSEWIAGRARGLGFALCGVVNAAAFPELEHFGEWLERGYHGEMKYLEDARRRDPSLAMDLVRSVIVCGLNYNTENVYSVEAERAVANAAFKPAPLRATLRANSGQAGAAPEEKSAPRNNIDGVRGLGKEGVELPHSEGPWGWISRYAWGDDYHEVMWARLNALEAAMRERFAEPYTTRAYADTGPVSERVLAKYAGLGWLGKNTLLLNREFGSWLFLGVILTSLQLAPSLASGEAPPRDLCGSCRKCLEACPTGALVEPYVLDARRCISYLTIELRGTIPDEFREAMGWQIYGCDICQDVCPYNRKAPVTEMPEFEPRQVTAEVSLLLPKMAWLAGLSEEEFRKLFRKSAMKRAKWRGMVRNACIGLGNAGLMRSNRKHAEAIAAVEKLAKSTDFVIGESARWAVGRIR